MAAGQGFVAVVGARVLPEAFASPVSAVVSFFLSRRALCGQATWRERRPYYMRSFISLHRSPRLLGPPSRARMGYLAVHSAPLRCSSTPYSSC